MKDNRDKGPDERMDPEWTPLKKDVSRRDAYGHLVIAGRNGCMVAGCKQMDTEYASENRPSVITEPQQDFKKRNFGEERKK